MTAPRSIQATRRVLAVGVNTYREAVRNRTFVGLLFFAVAFILLSLVMSELTVVGQGPRVVQNFGFFAIGLFGVITSVVMGALLVYKELEQKTIYTIVSKPIRRFEVVLGKYLGLLGILVVQLACLGVVWALAMVLQGVTPGLEHLKGWSLILVEVGVVAATAVMFSAWTSPVLTGLFSFGVFAVGRVIYLLEEMLGQSRGLFVDNPVARGLGEAVVMIFPDLSAFDVSQQVLLQVPVGGGYLLHATLYGLGYIVVALCLGMVAFERRDFV